MRRENPAATCTSILLMLALLSACSDGGDDGAPGPGPGVVPGGSLGVGDDVRGPSPLPTSRFDMANGCYALRDVTTGNFLSASGDGVAYNASSLSTAAPLFLKPTALGQYLFYTADRRFIALGSPAEPIGQLVAAIPTRGGQTVSGVGDLLALVNPAVPVADALNQVGAAIVGGSTELEGAANEFAGYELQRADAPSEGAVWTVDGPATGFSVVSSLTGDDLAPGAVQFVPHSGCAEFPEAKLNARGTPFKGTNPDGTVFGYAETHMHLGGSEALGGRLGYGSPFHKFGITHALGDCAEDHGPNGLIDALDAVIKPNRMFLPPHETQGWPTYADWPNHGSQTHHQTYYIWVKRAWLGGLRFMMNHLVANEQLCLIWPVKQHDCNEMDSIALQRQLILDMQDYIDAQEGGPGKGFFRIVDSSTEARRVIEDGKMAVVFGTENEKIFDCGEFLDQPECTREHIDAELDRWHGLGLRAIFPIHLFDNALGGTRLADDPALSVIYQGGNLLDTGHPYATIPCAEADGTEPGAAPVQERGGIEAFVLSQLSPPPLPPLTGCVENARGLSELGDYFVNGMVDRGILIETDHSGTLSRKRMLDIAAARDVPVLSGHTGFVSNARDTRRILEVGGVISNLPDEPAPVTIDFIQRLAAVYAEVHGSTAGFATGLGSDINGIHVQPAPRDDAATNPLVYPFVSYDGRVVFDRQVTGERVFDLNTDGVAHYGLYPDFIADLQRSPGGVDVMPFLFRSAEAYLQAWARAEAARVD